MSKMGKNWHKVLIPELVAIGLSWVIFFGCCWLGLEINRAAGCVVAISVIFVVISAFAKRHPLSSVATTLACMIVLITGSAAPTIQGAVFSTQTVIAVLIYGIIFGSVMVTMAFIAAKENKLSKVWVTTSFFLEGVAIFLPIFLSFRYFS